MSVYTAKEIMEIIPHRHPFMLIDTIEELEEGVRAVGKKCVSFNEPYFAGHFPGNPVMPGVLIIEALAQVGAVATLGLEGQDSVFCRHRQGSFQAEGTSWRCADA